MKLSSTKKRIVKKSDYSPTLNTIMMIEDTLQNMNYSVIKVSQLKKILPRKVNHYTLIATLDYLDKSNKIAIGTKGITWIFNDNPEMRKAIAEGFTISPKDIRKLLAKTYK